MTAGAPGALAVLCAGAVKGAAAAAARAFEQAGGAAVGFEFGTAGGLGRRVAAGEAAGLLIASRSVLDELAAAGTVLADSVADVGSVGVGIAVREGAPLPDVSSPEHLREVLLAARSIACSDPSTGDSSGLHFAEVLRRLGISEAVKDKQVLARLGLEVAEHVAGGKAELGVTQGSVIQGCLGIQLAGMLPASLQHITVYAAGIPVRSHAPAQARLFLDYLATPEARGLFEARGFATPGSGEPA